MKRICLNSPWLYMVMILVYNFRYVMALIRLS